MRAVFLGTPDPAVPSLRALAEIAEVGLVITQPDRPRGRSGRLMPPPVKEAAETLGLAVAQPETSGEIEALLRGAGPVDVAVVVAYGMLIRPAALQVPHRGFVNVHFSLLPRWRGAAPVQHAIRSRDRMTGVTLMRLDEGLDTGPVIATIASRLEPAETAGDVLERLAVAGARLVRSVLPAYVGGEIVSVPQDHAAAVHAPKIHPEDRRLDPSRTVADFVATVHSLSPRPGGACRLEGDRFKVLRARAASIDAPGRPSGELWLEDDSLFMRAGDGVVELIEVQPPGRRVMHGADWARGRRGELGTLE